MSEIPTTPIPNVSPEGNKAPARKRSLRWRIFRFCVLSLVGLITLFALFHAEENWRGKRAWEQYRKEQEAKGVSFEFSSMVPPPVPDEKNFAMTPLLKPLLDLNPPGSGSRIKDAKGSQLVEALSISPQPWSENQVAVNNLSHWRLGNRFSLEKWQAAIFDSTNLLHRAEKSSPGEDVLYALKQYEAALTELQTAAQTRPLSRFPVHYEEEDKAGILLPHLAKLKGISKTFQLRAMANLSLGKTDLAFADANMIFTLMDSIQSEPIMISKLVRYACLQIALQTIWEGLIDHRWKPEHLAYWQHKLSDYDFVKDGYQGMQGERVFGNSIIEYIRKYPHQLNNIGDPNMNIPADTGFERHLYKLVPTGWFYLEQINYNRLYDDFILNTSNKDKAQLDVKQVKDASDRMNRLFSHRDPITALTGHKILSNILVPSMDSFIQRATFTQSTTDLAIVALALELYHLKNQDYPATLADLTPETSTLPMDIAAKQPLKYERQSKDAFRLWSVGWNQKDDGGVTAKGSGNSTGIKIEDGDWTWPQPVKE